MSTPERPLTRRQLKEMRRTGQLSVITAEEAAEAAGSATESGQGRAETQVPRDHDRNAPVADDPASEPAETSATADAPEDEHRPRTRRELRMQRLRTNQMAVVPSDDGDEPDDALADESMAPQPAARMAIGFDGAGTVDDEAPTGEAAEELEPVDDAPAEAEVLAEDAPAADEAAEPDSAHEAPADAEAPADEVESAGEASEDGESSATESEHPQVGASFGAAVFRQAEERQRAEREQAEREAAERREVKEHTEAEKDDGEEEPASEETGELAAEAFQRSIHSGGSASSNTSSLILKDMPGTGALSAPVTATGEVILTSSHTLPAGLGTHGAAHGTTDGKDIDELLIDGEIPQHSSPTPIAASSAVSTSKAPGDVIRPPAPEKNHGLMLTLGITAGVLGVALIGVVVYVFATGALN